MVVLEQFIIKLGKQFEFLIEFKELFVCSILQKMEIRMKRTLLISSSFNIFKFFVEFRVPKKLRLYTGTWVKQKKLRVFWKPSNVKSSWEVLKTAERNLQSFILKRIFEKKNKFNLHKFQERHKNPTSF